MSLSSGFSFRGVFSFPASFRDHSGQVGTVFEAAAVISQLVLLGRFSSLRPGSDAPAAIRALWVCRRRPPGGLRDDGTDEEVSLLDIQVGERLRIPPGEKVPVDGNVLEGRPGGCSP